MSINKNNFQDILVCPLCKCELEFRPGVIRCVLCGMEFPQIREDCVDLLPDDFVRDREGQWSQRRRDMEAWYQDLEQASENVLQCFGENYMNFSEYLSNISGQVLDIGGKIGVARHYLPDSVDYVVLDPSVRWLDVDWSSLVGRFPCLKEKPLFVKGIGESLPFHSSTFDAVFSFWEMNHAIVPQRVFKEVARVLKSGGRFLLVLEDMKPRLLDFFDFRFPGQKVFDNLFKNIGDKDVGNARFRLLLKYLTQKEWPIHSDHIRIKEVNIRKWAEKIFVIQHRVWHEHLLAFEFVKK